MIRFVHNYTDAEHDYFKFVRYNIFAPSPCL
jgi:hypothetical protein